MRIYVTIVFTRFNLEYYFKISIVCTLNHKTSPYTVDMNVVQVGNNIIISVC